MGKKNKAKRHDDARRAGASGTQEGAKHAGGSLPKLDRDIMLTVAAYLEQATALASQNRPNELTELGKVVK